MRIFVLSLLCLLFVTISYAQYSVPGRMFATSTVESEPTDSISFYSSYSYGTPLSHQLFQMGHVSLPLIGVGLATYGLGNDFRELRNEFVPDFKYSYDDYLQYLPALTMIGLKSFGVEGRSSWGRMLTADAFSYAIMGGMVNGLKYSVKKMRPDDSQANSFPSGHTATAFMMATMLHREYGLTRSPLYSIGAYTVATATAVSRQLNNKHWVSDIFAGAGIGILSTQLGYYISDLIFQDKGLNMRPQALLLEENYRPSFMSLYMGAAILGKEITPTTDIRMTASVGTHVGIDAAYFFTPRWGVGTRFTALSVPIDFDETLFYSSHTSSQLAIESIVATPISTLMAMVGPYYHLPLAPRWALQFNMLAGYAYSQENTVVMTYLDDAQESQSIDFLESDAIDGFTFGGGASVVWLAKRNLMIKLFAEATHSLSNLNFTTKYIEDFPQVEYPQSISATNSLDYLTVGISFNALLW